MVKDNILNQIIKAENDAEKEISTVVLNNKKEIFDVEEEEKEKLRVVSENIKPELEGIIKLANEKIRKIKEASEKEILESVLQLEKNSDKKKREAVDLVVNNFLK